MQKQIEEYFIKRLQSYLLEYLQDFSQNNIANYHLGISTNIALKNLQIKKQALLNFSLPMYIINGTINSIILNMPLNYKAQQPEMIIDTIDLNICTIQEANLFVTKSQQQQGVENLKQHKLKIWEEKMAKYFEQLSPPSWISKIVDGIYNNMSISVKTINIIFSNYSIFGYETHFKIKIGNIFIKATDNKFQQKYNSDLNTMFKQIEIKQLSIIIPGQQILNTYLSQITKQQKEEQPQLQSIDIFIKLTIQKNQEQLDKPICDLMIKIDSPLIFQINKEQKDYLIGLNGVLKNLEIIQDNFHFRPKCEIKNNYGEWWKYLINAVMQNKKNSKLDLGYSSRRLVLMKRYIELYKRKQTIILVPWLTNWTLQDETKFKKCEDELSLKDLLKYREWAFQEIRIEAKRYYHSSKDGQNQQSVKPILEIWTSTINNQNSFKDHTKRDDDIPIELEDDEKINLYEILERDKTQVLASYLRGENNDPEQIKTQFEIKIHSLYIILLELRQQNAVPCCPKNTKIFSTCQCKQCLKVIKKPMESQKNNNSFNRTNSISEVIKQTEKQFGEGSFHTAKEIDSFFEDIQDLNKNEPSESFQSDNEIKQNHSNFKQQFETLKSNRMILLFSLVGIRIPIQIFQNGRLKTSSDLNKEQQDISKQSATIGEIKLISTGMIPKLMEEKFDQSMKQPQLMPKIKQKQNKQQQNINKDLQQQKQKQKNKISEFLQEVFDFSIGNIQAEQQQLLSEQCFPTFCQFLISNQMNNLKCFLCDYESDKHGMQDFSREQFTKYDKYFIEDYNDENEESMFLHIYRHPKNEKQWSKLKFAVLNNQQNTENQWITCQNKHRYLQEVHQKLIEIIKKSLFSHFIQDYGEKIIPICITNLKDKLSFPTDSKFHDLTITLMLEGSKSEYKIQPNNDKKKKISSTTTLNENFQPTVKISMIGFSIFLSTKSLCSLQHFFKSPNQSQLREGQLYVTQDHKLLECILKSKPLEKENIIQGGVQFRFEMQNKMKIRIVSDQICNKMKTELKIQAKNASFATVRIDELFVGINNYKETTLYKQHSRYYNAKKLFIQQLKITHKYFSPDFRSKIDEFKNNEKEEKAENKILSHQPTYQQSQIQDLKVQSFQQTFEVKPKKTIQQNVKFQENEEKQKIELTGIKQTILTTQIALLKLDAKVENHALLTDSKLYIQIPHFHFYINDSAICFIELITILNKMFSSQSQRKKFNQKISQDSLLKAEIDSLQNDHKPQNTDCKHCILKYRKTISLTNIMFGVVQEIQREQMRIPSWFNILHNILNQQEQTVFNSQEKYLQKRYGIKLVIQSTQKNQHHIVYQSKIIFPLLIITRDLGYFKDNFMIHSSRTKFKGYNRSLQSAPKLDCESEISSINQFEKSSSNRELIHKKKQQKSHSKQQIEKHSNYFLIQPGLQVEENLQFLQKLDDKFIFYCRTNEKRMFTQEQSQNSEPLDSKIYILFYKNTPLRSSLIGNKDNELIQKKSKLKIFLNINEIKSSFLNQQASLNIIITLTNIMSISKIFENIHSLCDYDYKNDIKEKQILITDSPIKKLDDLIIFAVITNIHFESHESFIDLSSFTITLNLDFMNQGVVSNINKITHKKNIESASNLQQFSSSIKSQSNNFHQSDYLLPIEEENFIVKCMSIKFNFSKLSTVIIKQIQIKKEVEKLFISIEDIEISIQNESFNQKETLLSMPKNKDNALLISFEFCNMSPMINLTFPSANLYLSQKRVYDLLVAINSYYLINVEETISLKKYLQQNIFHTQLEIYDIKQPQLQQINLFINKSIKQTKEILFILEIKVDNLFIQLSKKIKQEESLEPELNDKTIEQQFFEFNFQNIEIKKKLNQILEISVQEIKLKPQDESSQVEIDTKFKGEKIQRASTFHVEESNERNAQNGNFAKKTRYYENLIEKNGDLQPIFKLENNIIHIENIRFFMISKYLNQLDSFKQEIENILRKNREELAQKYENDFDQQLKMKEQENFLLNKDLFCYSLILKNSTIIVPELSNSENKIFINFTQCDVRLTKQVITEKIPQISDDAPLISQILQKESQQISDDAPLISQILQKASQQKEKKETLIIDYNEQYEKGIDNKPLETNVCVYMADIQLETVNLAYEIHEQNQICKGQLLTSQSVGVKIKIPSFEQYLSTSGWKYKDYCKIKPINLHLQLDFGKFEQIRSFFDKNINEDLEGSSLLKKMNFKLKLKSMASVQFTTFQKLEKDKMEKYKAQAQAEKHTMKSRQSQLFIKKQ